MPAKPNLRLVKPTIQKRAVGPLRRPNSEFRSREHLTETEVEKLIKAAEGNRHGHRDATMILVAYRHGLRASEICDAMGVIRFQCGHAARPKGEEWEAKHASHSGRRTAGAAKTPAGCAKITIRVRERTWWAIHDG